MKQIPSAADTALYLPSLTMAFVKYLRHRSIILKIDSVRILLSNK